MLLHEKREDPYPACQLDNDSLDELAVALVEFAEDIHAGIGL
jgi:hypothetical protein